MLAGVDEATAVVLIVKVALLLPAGMVTLEGTLAAALLLESRICAPPKIGRASCRERVSA